MCVFVLLFCRVILTFLLPRSMNINDIKRGYILLLEVVIFKVLLHAYVMNTPCYSLLLPFTPEF